MIYKNHENGFYFFSCGEGYKPKWFAIAKEMANKQGWFRKELTNYHPEPAYRCWVEIDEFSKNAELISKGSQLLIKVHENFVDIEVDFTSADPYFL